MDTIPLNRPASIALVQGTVRHGVELAALDEAGVLIEAGRITHIAAEREIRTLADRRGVATVELGGGVVVPGFIDSHYHAMSTGLNSLGVDLYDCRQIADVREVLRETASRTPSGEWLLGHRLDEGLLAEGRAPTMRELRGLHDGPIFLNDRGLHYVVLDERGWTQLGIDSKAAGVQWAEGRPTGRLQEHASGVGRSRLSASLPRETRVAALRRGLAIGARRGITTVHAMEGGELFDDGDARLLHSICEDLPIHVVLYWCTDDGASARKLGLPRHGGDICIDGSLGSRTARLFEPYADTPGQRGELLRSEDEITGLIASAERHGMQIGFHAIGDEAIEVALRAFERVLEDGTELRHRIEHFGLPRPGHAERAAHLGIAIPTQPAFAYLRGGRDSIYEQRLGPERERTAYPLRSLIDAGLLVAGGSDSDVTPADPLLGMQACVEHPNEDERLTARDALALFTVNGARIGFEEAERGVLAEGLLGDCAVLDRDPVEAGPGELSDIEVLMTLSEGHIAHAVPDFAPDRGSTP